MRRDLEATVRDLRCTTVMLIGDGERLIDAARPGSGTESYRRTHTEAQQQLKAVST
ncbi:hypothetical protein AB0J81_18520 [Streptomyces bobili]|uniref:hypothetical protein n=1 Tax=Streptomyces bobili TaxID=67280 RepID=UPI003422B185